MMQAAVGLSYYLSMTEFDKNNCKNADFFFTFKNAIIDSLLPEDLFLSL